MSVNSYHLMQFMTLKHFMRPKHSVHEVKARHRARKHAILFSISFVLILLSACGKEEREGLAGSLSGSSTYALEYLPLEQNNASFPDIVITDGQVGCLYLETDEKGTTASVIRLYSLTDKSVAYLPLPLQSGESLYKYTLDKNGCIYAVLSSWHTDDSGADGGYEEYTLAVIQPDGEELFRQDITSQIKEDSPASIKEISIDGQGRLYVLGSSRIWLYSADGAYQGDINLSEQKYSWYAPAGTDKKGALYIAGQNRDGYTLTEVNFDRQSLGTSYHSFYDKGEIYLFGKGMEKDFLISDGISVYEYDLEDQGLLELFKWMDYDINGTDIQNISGIPGGGIAAAGKDNVTNEYFLVRLSDASRTDISDIASEPSSENVAPSPVPEKQEIVLAALSFKNDPTLRRAAVSFNKASDKYHITLKEYGTPVNDLGERYERWTMEEWLDAITGLNTDLTSQDCPDIVDISDINIAELADKGVFLDIQPYLDASSVISSADYPDNVLAGCTYDGKLLGIPKFISVTTVMGHASDLGEVSGWTLEDMIAYAKAHPGAELFEDATKSDILNYCMSFYESCFIDSIEKKSYFDSLTFKQLLEFVNGFPDQKEQQSGEFISPPVKIRNRDVLLEKPGYIYFQIFSIRMPYLRRTASLSVFLLRTAVQGMLCTHQASMPLPPNLRRQKVPGNSSKAT